MPCYQNVRSDTVVTTGSNRENRNIRIAPDHTMKTFITLLASLSVAATAFAGSLQPNHVAENAKWVAHLDVEKAITTELGAYLGRTFLDKKLAKPVRDLEQWGIDFDWRDIEAITVYGTEFKKKPEDNAVLLIKGSFNFASALEVVIDRIAEYGGDDRPIQKVQSEPYPIYSAKGEVFGAPFGKDLFLISKSKSGLEQARSVLDGKTPSIASTKSFPGINSAGEGFLVAAVADGFQSLTKLPPQMQGLKTAQSLQIQAGEKSEKIFAKLSVNTRDSESATQMQQVLQGILALGALSQEQNKDLALLVNGTKVGSSEKTVTVALELPAETVIAKVIEKQPKRRK